MRHACRFRQAAAPPTPWADMPEGVPRVMHKVAALKNSEAVAGTVRAAAHIARGAAARTVMHCPASAAADVAPAARVADCDTAIARPAPSDCGSSAPCGQHG